MSSGFKKILRLQVHHDYFEKEAVYPISLVPTAESKQLISQYGFKVFQITNGLELYSNSSQSMDQFFNYLKTVSGQDSFVFKLIVNKEVFYQYTDFPINKTGRLRYRTEDQKETAPGTYELLKGWFEEGEFPEILLATFSFHDLLTEGESGNTYHLNFNARKTQWRYYIINKSALPLDNPTIFGKSEIEFEGPEEVIIQNGQHALLFSSGQNLLPLSARPKHQFNLVNRTKKAQEFGVKMSPGKSIFAGLPNPNPMQLTIEKNETNQLIASPMYVYI